MRFWVLIEYVGAEQESGILVVTYLQVEQESEIFGTCCISASRIIK